jgi:hypothetical protein
MTLQYFPLFACQPGKKVSQHNVRSMRSKEVIHAQKNKKRKTLIEKYRKAISQDGSDCATNNSTLKIHFSDLIIEQILTTMFF